MVSFDFDSTLDKKTVQEYAQDLINRGIDVWICTSRFSPENAPNKEWNDDLFKIADELEIPRDNIVFTNYADKCEFLKDTNFIWHLDDDWIELKEINKQTKTLGISVFGNTNWKNKCERILKKHEKNKT